MKIVKDILLGQMQTPDDYARDAHVLVIGTRKMTRDENAKFAKDESGILAVGNILLYATRASIEE